MSYSGGALRIGVSAAGAIAIAVVVSISPARAVGPNPGGVTGAPAGSPTAALIVGGTSFPSVPRGLIEQMWPLWAHSLGIADPASTSLINVPYPAQLYPFTTGATLGSSVAAGVTSLLALVTATYVEGQQLIVWGISQGALVLGAAQVVLAHTPFAPPAGSLIFVQVADPAAAVNGMLNFLPGRILSKVLHCTTALCTPSTDSQYNTVVVRDQYDGFADFPDKPRNLLAVANALVGLYYRHAQTGGADLTAVPPRNIATSVNGLGATTTTYLVPAPFLPITQPLRDLGVSAAFVDRLDRVLRPVIEAAYTRSGPSPSNLTAHTTTNATRVAANRNQNRRNSKTNGSIASRRLSSDPV